MTDRPIIFSAAMVRALLDGRKVQTRRLAWAPSHLAGLDFASEHLEDFELRGWNVVKTGNLFYVHKPTPWQRVQPGDDLWVRESLDRRGVEGIGYSADGSAHPDALWRWRRDTVPSIHMPRWASRLTLTVTEVRRQRLLEIAGHELDTIAEGVTTLRGAMPAHYEAAFRSVWTSLHGDQSWDANPEVVALTFTVARQNIDALARAA